MSTNRTIIRWRHFTSTTRTLQCVLQFCANKGYWSLILSGDASLRTADAFPVVASFDRLFAGYGNARFEQERKDKMYSGSCSQMSWSWKWPISLLALLLILQGLQKDNAASKTEYLFDAESTAYIKSVTYCGISIAVLVFIFLIYEIVTRKKRNPNAKRYGKTLF